MPNLSIKNVPEPVLDRLRQRARQNHRSLQEELLAILEAAVQPPRISLADAVQRVKALGLVTADDAQLMVRADRDARLGSRCLGPHRRSGPAHQVGIMC